MNTPTETAMWNIQTNVWKLRMRNIWTRAKTSHEQRKYCNSVISILKEEICISEAEIRHGRKRVRMCTAHCPFAERQANFVDKDYNHFKCTLKISYCSRETVVVFSFSSVFFSAFSFPVVTSCYLNGFSGNHSHLHFQLQKNKFCKNSKEKNVW